MTPVVFLNPLGFWAAWVPFVLLALQFRGARRGAQALTSFVSCGQRDLRVMENLPTRDRIGLWLVFIGACSLVVTLARPGWKTETATSKTEGRDVAVVLDVSRSMAAEDLSPNRLAWAKQMVRAWSENIEDDRVALVVFSDRAAVRCPLTHDVSFFRQTLEDVGTESVAGRGTHLAVGLEETLSRVFTEEVERPQVALLLTDGENLQPGLEPVLQKARARRVRWVVVGLGDEGTGARIPVVDETGRKRFLRYKNQEVWSKMDRNFLEHLAADMPGSVFLKAAGSPFAFSQWLRRRMEKEHTAKLDEAQGGQCREWFQIPLGLAWLVLSWDFLRVRRWDGVHG
uniref:VWA domain-containing protein n=1 Tax=Desulfacinum infernum TaxID=35837 RepID=A0A832A4M3_9BACT